MKLGSEGVYLHEKCGTNPSRHLPGPKTTIKKLKMLVLGSRGFRAEILYINSRSTALSGLYVNFYTVAQATKMHKQSSCLCVLTCGLLACTEGMGAWALLK